MGLIIFNIIKTIMAKEKERGNDVVRFGNRSGSKRKEPLGPKFEVMPTNWSNHPLIATPHITILFTIHLT